MSNDVSKVYQFLSTVTDWKTKADKNGDGTIIKSEFRSFLEENYEWDGETTDAGKNDLINTFWKSIDTNQSGKISGTRYKNKNALDKSEVTSMENRIAIYEKLNEYTATIDAPSEVSDKAAWKKSVAESLGNYTEAFIKQGVTADTLAEELDKIIENVKNKTTADYCANEYLNTSMKDVVKQYGYAYADDTTLTSIIDNFVNNLPEDADSASIKQTVEEIIDAYMATATGDGSEDISILQQYGYSPSNNGTMNDLQKSIVKTKLTEALADLKNEADYKNNSALYDTAINEYIESILSAKTYGDYANENIEYSIQAFKDSETGKALTKTIEVKNLFNSDELKTAITNKLSSSFADRISGLMKGEISAYDDIQAQALEKAKNGDFDTNGTLDTNKAIEWVVEQMTQRLTEFYPNGLNDMSLTDLGTMYDKLVESAKGNDDADSVKNAALSYCNAVAKKSTKLAEAVKDVFGSSYSTEINKLTTPEIEAKMTELKAKVEEIGDVSTMTEAEKNALISGLKDNYTFGQGATTNNIQVGTSTTCNGKTVTSDRITYSTTGNISVDSSGKVTIDTSNAGTYSGTITVSIDGQKVVSKTITFTIEKTNASLANSIDNSAWGGDSEHLEVYGLPGVGDGKVQLTSQSFADLYNNNAIIMLHRKNNNDTYTSTVTDRLTSLCGFIVNALASKGLDSTKLQNASKKVISNLMSNYSRKGKSENNTEGTALGTKVSNEIKAGKMNGVVKYTDFKGKDYQVNMVSFKEVVDLILQEYGY